MSILTVRYRVLVYATVDTDENKVIDVKEVDEDIELDIVGAGLEADKLTDDDALEVVEREIDGASGDTEITVELAIDVAENAPDGWPSWDRV